MRVSNALKRRRDAATNCHYCGCELTHVKVRRGHIPWTNATIEHLNSRLQYPDGRPNANRGDSAGLNAIVIACRRCNEGRAAREEAALPLAELHRRAGRGEFA